MMITISLCTKSFLLCLFLAIGTVAGQNIANESEFEHMCMGCLCEASTRCNTTMPCTVSAGMKLCGPFLISKPYWADAGFPVLSGDNPSREGAYEDCATDPYCAASIVRGYMEKFGKDCNGDGVIDCDDFARIHLMGAFACSSPTATTQQFYKNFNKCHKCVKFLSEASGGGITSSASPCDP